jgi:hypothetical protein
MMPTKQIKDVGDIPLTLTTAQKLVGALITVVVGAAGLFGGKLLIEYKITALQKDVEELKIRVIQMEQIGHPEHERRITRLEVRADTSDRDKTEMKAKLDVAVAILQRLEKKVDEQSKH